METDTHTHTKYRIEPSLRMRAPEVNKVQNPRGCANLASFTQTLQCYAKARARKLATPRVVVVEVVVTRGVLSSRSNMG